MAQRLSRGDVHLLRFPHPDKERPVVILTRASAMGLLTRVTVAPITSTIRGVASEVALDVPDGMKGPCAVNLHNIATVAHERVGRRVATLTAARMEAICASARFALGCS